MQDHDHQSVDPSDMEIHQRLLERNLLASRDVARLYFDGLCGWLRGVKPGLDPHDYQMAAEDAMIDLIEHPDKYQPERGGLRKYLRVDARNRLNNVLRAERKHSKRRASLEAVELSEFGVKYRGDELDDPAEVLERREREEELFAQLPRPHNLETGTVPQTVTEGLTSIELEVLTLHLRRERKTSVFAQAMGIADMPKERQKIEVKKVKDKLDKRLKRAGVKI